VIAQAPAGRRQQLAAVLRWPGAGREVTRTAVFNVGAAVAAALGGIVVARVLGPTVRGEYAAVTSWFGLALIVGGMGQPAALCFFVAHDPGHARGYVATSRALMLLTGAAALAGGMLLAPLLAHGNAGLADGYRIAFAAAIVAFVGASYTFSLQAADLVLWNVVRLSQPLLSVCVLALLWLTRLLTLQSSLVALAATMLAQLGLAYGCCRRAGLAPGRARMDLVRPLAAYGTAQMAALTPATLNSRLDQLVLSQAVPAADLGRYAVAVTLTLVPIPLVSAIGNVAFPRLAARREVTAAMRRLQWLAVLGSAGLAAAMLVPLALVAYWVIPLVFGPGYEGAVPLVWILAPGAVFLSCAQVTGDILRGRKRPILVAWAEGTAAVFTVVLLLALLPVAGVYGAAIASTVAYGVALGVMLWCLRRLPAADPGGCPPPHWPRQEPR
jgi:O-antigen/teichoic acid export membrane protein